MLKQSLIIKGSSFFSVGMVEAAGVEPTYPHTIFNIIKCLIFSGGTAGIPSAYFHRKFVPKILKYLVKVGVIDGAIFATDLLLVIIPSRHHFSTSLSDTPRITARSEHLRLHSYDRLFTLILTL
ncbi:MAG: hypothetical protein ABIF87_17425 [Pseudomonadota bacterium]